MAESTLSLTFTELQFAVGHYLGLGPVATWSATELVVINMTIESGLRQFYFPEPSADGKVHEWSFLKPTLDMVTIAPYSTGTIAVAITGTTVTLTTGVWPTWTATHGSLVVDTSEYTIASRTDDTHLELDDAWTETTETTAEYTLKHDGNYDLPDDYGGIEGDLVIESVNYQPDIKIVGEGRIRSGRQQSTQNSQSSTSTAYPAWAAIRPKKHETTTTGQRFEIMFFPLPSSVLTISYVQRVNPQMLVTTTLAYPYGGMTHAETLRAACVAAAEEQENGNRMNGNPVYDKQKLFKGRLAASIRLDKQMNGVDFYGYNRDDSDARHREGPESTNDRNRCRDRDTGLVTYLGNT